MQVKKQREEGKEEEQEPYVDSLEGNRTTNGIF